MTVRTIRGVFDCEQDLVQAAEGARQAGWRVVDVYSPYPLHATAHLLGLRRCRIPTAAFVYAALGVAAAFGFQFWASARDWPLNVGGRPWNSWPAFVPVTFEMMVLCAGIGAAITLLMVCGLYPGKPAALPDRRVTNDSFVVEVQALAAGADPEPIRRRFLECRAIDVHESEGAGC